jgi:hypothetical protein
MVNRWMSRRISTLAGQQLPDTQCGFRLIKLQAFAALSLESTHFEIESEVLLGFVRSGCRVDFVPIQVVGKGPHSHIHPITDAWRWMQWWRRAREKGQAGAAPASAGWLMRLAKKGMMLLLLGTVFGFGYDWAVPRFYGPERKPGFPLGVLHGALMPVALPSLLLGKDVPIYAERNQGRVYKLGYIAGINLCGMIFFGSAFWSPRKASATTAKGAPPAQ